jgi:hypothetical protein
MTDVERALNADLATRVDRYAQAYVSTMYEVIYKPQVLLRSIQNPVLGFFLKFLHPSLFLRGSFSGRNKPQQVAFGEEQITLTQGGPWSCSVSPAVIGYGAHVCE